MGSGFAKFKKQARQMEQQYEKMREEMKQKEVVGSSGNGLVTITFTGEKEMKKIEIKPECVHLDDLEGLQDLILAACKNAYQKIESQSKEGMGPSSVGSLPFPMDLM